MNQEELRKQLAYVAEKDLLIANLEADNKRMRGLLRQWREARTSEEYMILDEVTAAYQLIDEE